MAPWGRPIRLRFDLRAVLGAKTERPIPAQGAPHQSTHENETCEESYIYLVDGQVQDQQVEKSSVAEDKRVHGYIKRPKESAEREWNNKDLKMAPHSITFHPGWAV